MLVPDATWTADSGGRTTAARRPVVGAEKAAAVLTRTFRGGRPADPRIKGVDCTGAPAMRVHSGGHPEGVFLVEITEGKLTGVYAVRDRDKLAGVAVLLRTSR
ncbi:hypothetical protein [Streptomyces sp. NPDC052721]|uniref:hypothetical protein n=1 Tax=Streptomyces sp. NPDC052721 TaxID=3154955 RepID=UPI0034491CD1